MDTSLSRVGSSATALATNGRGVALQRTSDPDRAGATSRAVDAIPVRVVIADAEPMFRYGLRRLFEATRHIQVVAEACDMPEAIAAVRECLPDLLFISPDIRDGGQDDPHALERLQKSVGCVILTKGGAAAAPVSPGVCAVVAKEAPATQFLKCIEAVMRNRCPVARGVLATCEPPVAASVPDRPAISPCRLTRRESQIVAAVVNGASNKDIAAALSISLYTVKHHLGNVFDKTGVGSRLELAMFALYHGLASHD